MFLNFFRRKNIILALALIGLLAVFIWSFEWHADFSSELDPFWRQGFIMKLESVPSENLSPLFTNQKIFAAYPAALNFFCGFNNNKDTHCLQRLRSLRAGDGLGWTITSDGQPFSFVALKKTSWSELLTLNPAILRAQFTPRLVGTDQSGNFLWHYRQYEIIVSEEISIARVRSLIKWLRQPTLFWNPLKQSISFGGYLNLEKLPATESWLPQLNSLQSEFSRADKNLFWRAEFDAHSWQLQIPKNSLKTRFSVDWPPLDEPLVSSDSGWRYCQGADHDLLWNMTPRWFTWYPDLYATWQDSQAKNLYQFNLTDYLSWLRQPLCFWSLSDAPADQNSALPLKSTNPIYLLDLSQAQDSWPTRLEKDWQSFVALQNPQIENRLLPDRTIMREIIPSPNPVPVREEATFNGLSLRSLMTENPIWNLHYIFTDPYLLLSNRVDWLKKLSSARSLWMSAPKTPAIATVNGKFNSHWSDFLGWQFWQLVEDQNSWNFRLWNTEILP